MSYMAIYCLIPTPNIYHHHHIIITIIFIITTIITITIIIINLTIVTKAHNMPITIFVLLVLVGRKQR